MKRYNKFDFSREFQSHSDDLSVFKRWFKLCFKRHISNGCQIDTRDGVSYFLSLILRVFAADITNDSLQIRGLSHGKVPNHPAFSFVSPVRVAVTTRRRREAWRSAQHGRLCCADCVSHGTAKIWWISDNRVTHPCHISLHILTNPVESLPPVFNGTQDGFK